MKKKELLSKINLFLKIASMSVDEAAKILGVARSASKEEITKSYKALTAKYHPDVNQEPDAHEKMSLLNRAKAVMDAEVEKRPSTKNVPFEVSNKPYEWKDGIKTPVKNLPKVVQKALRQIGFKRNTVELLISSTSRLQSRSAFDHSRGYVATVNLDTGATQVEYGDWGGPGLGRSRVDLDEQVYTVPDNFAFILGKEGPHPYAKVVLSPSYQPPALN